MLHPEYAEMLPERQLAATDWIEDAHPPERDLSELHAFRDKLKEIRARNAWSEIIRLDAPKAS
jgi:hypothetical protein